MKQSDSFSTQQGGTTLYIALTLLVLVGAGAGVYFLSQNQAQDDVAALPAQDQPLADAEPDAIQSVDMQTSEIDDNSAGQVSGEPSANEADAGGLFERGGRKIPLEDGLAGGSEASNKAPGSGNNNDSSNTARQRKLHALDAFDYGVLDGRVRIGIFGKGPIPDYRVRLTQTDYIIDMPGEFRYLDQFGRALLIEQFGVRRAWLERTDRGMRMRIDVTQGLQHKPFLIEDAKGLIIAFEPRR